MIPAKVTKASQFLTVVLMVLVLLCLIGMKTELLTVPLMLSKALISFYIFLLVVSIVLGIFALLGLHHMYNNSEEITKLLNKQQIQAFLDQPPKVKQIWGPITLMSVAIIVLAIMSGLWFLALAETISEIMTFYINSYGIAIYDKIKNLNRQEDA
jgi:uncharacterized membrane protein